MDRGADSVEVAAVEGGSVDSEAVDSEAAELEGHGKQKTKSKKLK
jgi:hypothetical protein